MEILFKFNSRVKLCKASIAVCEFLIDDVKTSFYYPMDPQLYMLITNLNSKGFNKKETLESFSDDNKIRGLQFLETLEVNGFINYEISLPSGIRFEIKPTRKNFSFPEINDHHGKKLYFSKFSLITIENGNIVLTNPLANFRVVFQSNFGDIFKFLSNINDTIAKSTHDELVSILLAGSFINIEENGNSPFRFWEFHDLIFHSRSRAGLLDDNTTLGATYRFKNSNIGTCNDFKKYDNHSYYPLNRSDVQAVQYDLFDVLCNRKSTRAMGGFLEPTLDQLNLFLFNTVSVKKVNLNPNQETTLKRAYPSAGGLHELEFYLVINRSKTFPRDVYYYHPVKHGLFQLKVASKYIDEIIHNASIALGGDHNSPPVLVVITSKFRKIASKYERIAYRSTLISSGAALQNMQLVGTALNLSICIVGAGSPTLFAEAIGVNEYEECSIVELALGSNVGISD